MYTPDGTIGRVTLSGVTGSIGIYSMLVAFGFLVNPWAGSLLIVPMAAILGITLTMIAVLTLWPVYLSAIGRIDSPEENIVKSDDKAKHSSIEELKTKYQRGELTEGELERELEATLDESSSRLATNPPSTDRVDDFLEREKE